MVTVDGKPASGAHVTLHPVADVGLGAVTPSGVGSPDGSFELTTYAPADGAPAGKYHVTVSWADQISGGSDPEYGKEKLPARYQQPTLSGLACEISPDNTNSLVFALKSR
jgi:hypothetical protein